MRQAKRDPFRNFNTYKIDPVTEIRNAGIVTNGDVYWVSTAADGQHRVRTDALGKDVVKLNIQAGIDATLADQNDYVLVIPKDDNGSFSQGTALDIDKDRLHLLSIGMTKAKNTYVPMISGDSGTSTDSEVIAVTGDGVEVGGFQSQGTVGTGDGGTMTNGNLYVNAHDFWGHDLYVEQKVDGWSESPCLTFGGTKHGARFDDCHFAVNGTGNVEAAAQGVIALGAAGKKHEYHNCTFTTLAGSATDAIVVTGAGAKEYTLFDGCSFINRDATFTPASAFTGSVDVDNPVILHNCVVVGCTDAGTDPNVYIAPAASGTTPSVYNPGVAMGTAAVVAV